MSEKDYLDDLLATEPMDEDIDQMILQTKREIGMLNDVLPQQQPAAEEEFRDQEYRDTFDENFARAFEESDTPQSQQTEQDLPEPADAGAQPPKEKKPSFWERRRRRRRKKRRDNAAFAFFGTIIYFVLVAAAAIMIAKFAWLCADDVLALTKEDSVVSVSINESETLETITDKLYDAGLINYPWLFKIYGKYSHVTDKVSPGVYELNTLYDYHALVNGMSGSYNRLTTQVTVIEGRTSKEIFEQLEEEGICSVEALEEAAANTEFDYEFLQDLPYGESNRLEGYLFPDTYEFYLNDDADRVLNKFLSTFDNRMGDELMARVEESGYTLHEILTVASIIQEEAATMDECSDIASVIYNRLNSESLRRLQMDSTVFYGAERMGTTFDTNLDSPYNTYVVEGLPVGPIANPGMDTIKAALYPSTTDYYYFAYGKDGVSHFYSDWDSFAAFLASDEYVGA